jgi:hypothetical protein
MAYHPSHDEPQARRARARNKAGRAGGVLRRHRSVPGAAGSRGAGSNDRPRALLKQLARIGLVY